MEKLEVDGTMYSLDSDIRDKAVQYMLLYIRRQKIGGLLLMICPLK